MRKKTTPGCVWLLIIIVIAFLVQYCNNDEENVNLLVSTQGAVFPTILATPAPATRSEMTQKIPKDNNAGCPEGCLFEIEGCDIKGNVSFDTKEKIYHIPGQEYYSSTVINSSYGERWFCTEEEAVINGWRKSYK